MSFCSTKYFRRLLGEERLQTNGHKVLYDCMLSLSGKQVERIHSRSGFRRLRSQEFKTVASGGKVPVSKHGGMHIAGAAPGSATDAVKDADMARFGDDGGGAVVTQPLAMAPSRELSDPFRAARIREHEVKFDYFSHLPV